MRGMRIPERGLYKTTDGGKTWQLIKFVSDKAGFVDVAMDPSESGRALRVELRARARPVLPQERRARERAVEEHRRRQDVDEDQGRRIPRDDEGTHQRRDLAQQSEHDLRAGRGGLDARSNHAVRAPASDSAGEKPKTRPSSDC